MNGASERHIEAAEASIQLENGARIAAIRSALAPVDDEDCIDCGRPVGEARKAAMPSAERCIGCQTSHERRSRA